MDTKGRVPEGEVTRSLLVQDPKSPFGLRTNRAAYLRTFRRVWQDKSVVLAEMSDLERADRYARTATSQQAAALRHATIRQLDTLLGGVLASVNTPRDLVLLVVPAAPRARGGDHAIWHIRPRHPQRRHPVGHDPAFGLRDAAPTSHPRSCIRSASSSRPR